MLKAILLYFEAELRSSEEQGLMYAPLTTAWSGGTRLYAVRQAELIVEPFAIPLANLLE